MHTKAWISSPSRCAHVLSPGPSHKSCRWGGAADAEGRGGSGSLCFLQRPEGELQSLTPSSSLWHRQITAPTRSPTLLPQTPPLPLFSITPNLISLCSLFAASYPLLVFLRPFSFFFIALCISPRIVQALIKSLTFNPSETSLLCLNLSFFFCLVVHLHPKHSLSPLWLKFGELSTLLHGPPNLLYLLFFHFPTQTSAKPAPDLKAHKSCTKTSRWDLLQCWIFCFPFVPGNNSLYYIDLYPKFHSFAFSSCLCTHSVFFWSCIISNKYKLLPHNQGRRYFFLKGFLLVKMFLQCVYWKGGRLPHFLLIGGWIPCCYG